MASAREDLPPITLRTSRTCSTSAIGHSNVLIHHLPRTVALNAIQLPVRTLGIGVIQRTCPKSAVGIGSGIVETPTGTAVQRIAERLEHLASGVPVAAMNPPDFRIPRPSRIRLFQKFPSAPLAVRSAEC